MPSLSSVPGPAASAVAETGGAEQAAAGDLVKQLQEKDRRIQYLELKIQQLSQVRWLPPTHHLHCEVRGIISSGIEIHPDF